MIKKINPPCHLDEAEYLTEWHCDDENGDPQIWIQTNDIDKRRWIRLGFIYERAVAKGVRSHCIKTLIKEL